MMAPAGPNRHYRWRGDGKSSYAARFHRKVWEKHEKDIRSLHAEGRTKNQILHVLYNQHDFRPSYGQLRKKLGRWFSKTTHSIELSSAATSLSERPLSPKKSCMDGLSLQSSRDGISLTKEEEEEEKVFKTFTSILDDANESLELSTGDSEHSSTDAKGDFSTNQKDVLQQKGFPSSSKSTTSSGDHPPPPTLAKPPQTNQIGRHPFTVVDVDPDEDEHPTVFGPSLPNQWSASTDSKNFEGLPTQISREYRKRYNSHQGLDSNTSRVMNKTRQRMRYTCCACGQVAHSIACEGCMHKRCGGCQTSPIARRIVNKD